MRVAVVGAGVSGLVCARLLAARHHVTLFEAEPRLGGHVNTVTVDDAGRALAIDTGFIVFNAVTYPRFTRLLDELGIAPAPSDMSFSARSDRRDFEYAATSLSTLFTQRRRLLQPRHHRMVRDILRFFQEGRALAADPGAGELPLGDWLRARRYSGAFIDDHLFPLARAVWSADREVIERFPARFLCRFFANHGFLQVADRVPWLTIPGGAQRYVQALLAAFRGRVLTGARVTRVRRDPGGVTLAIAGAEAARFDRVVLACHADQALALLDEPSPLEREVLGAFRTQRNDAVLHTDARVMPRTRRAWSSWNAHLDDDGGDGARVTYWMNRLQPLGAARDYFVTLNRPVDPARVLARFVYRHPVFTPAAVAAQARHAELLDHFRTSYCGAYWRHGFHEDGVVSAERVAARLLARPLAEAA